MVLNSSGQTGHRSEFLWFRDIRSMNIVMDLQLDLRVGVLTDAKNNGTQGT
jgi:hypothetical protein